MNESILICILGLIAHRFRAWLPGKDLGLIVFLPPEDRDAEKKDHDESLLALLVILCGLLWIRVLI